MKLRQLPISGDHIDPTRINAVWARMSPHYHVQIDLGGTSTTIECEGMDHARDVRDEIAGWANEEGDDAKA